MKKFFLKKQVMDDSADYDTLTKLNNKVALERKIKRYLMNNPNSVAILFIIDIDDLKEINEVYGREFGDKVLQVVAERMEAKYQNTSILGRSEADEFIVLQKIKQGSMELDKEIEYIKNMFDNFIVGEREKYLVTASIGGTIFPQYGVEYAELYQTADQALYIAKRQGKNQVIIYSE